MTLGKLCKAMVVAVLLGALVVSGRAQTAPVAATEAASSGTSTDLFVMMGSDIDRPGALPRANYNIGIGHTFGFLKKDPIGDELTFSYTYENAGSHGFLHTQYGEHTETLGVMKNFSIPKAKSLGGYTWLQMGPTSYTGNAKVENRLYMDSGEL